MPMDSSCGRFSTTNAIECHEKKKQPCDAYQNCAKWKGLKQMKLEAVRFFLTNFFASTTAPPRYEDRNRRAHQESELALMS